MTDQLQREINEAYKGGEEASKKVLCFAADTAEYGVGHGRPAGGRMPFVFIAGCVAHMILAAYTALSEENRETAGNWLRTLLEDIVRNLQHEGHDVRLVTIAREDK